MSGVQPDRRRRVVWWGGLACSDSVETLGVSADDQVLDIRTAAESSDLLEELPDLRVDESDDDEPVLLRADGQPVDTWRERYPYPERMGREEYERPSGCCRSSWSSSSTGSRRPVSG